MKTWALSAGLVVLSIVGSAESARADNSESFFYSDDAAMAAGAVSAVTRDTGAIWYQPAGLGGISRASIDLSGTAFALRIRNVPNAITTVFPGSTRSVNLQSNDVYSAPHALGFVRHISDTVSFGAGLYVTYRDVRTAENDQNLQGPALGDSTVNGTYRQRLDITQDSTRYHVGPAIGWEVIPGLRIGASLFGTYGKSSGYVQFLIGQQATLSNGASSTLLALGQSRTAFSYFGVQAQGGVQYEPNQQWSLSLLLRSPEMLLSSSADGATLASDTLVVPNNTPVGAFSLDNAKSDIGAFTVVAPAHVVVGVARQLGVRSWVSAEVDIQVPYSNSLADSQTVVNGRLGGRFRLNDKLSLGGGLYTDLSPKKVTGEEFGDERIDDIGLTFGGELRTPLSLKDKPDPDALVLSTTVAIKYDVGFGHFRATDADLETAGDKPPRLADVVYHSFIPYLGSSILF